MEIGGMRSLETIIEDISREIHDLMMIENPSETILKNIEELIMEKDKYSRRLAIKIAKKEASKRGGW